MKKTLFTIAALSMFAIGCDKEDDPTPTTPTTPTTPATSVKVGTKFTYTRSDYDGTGTNVNSTYDYTITIVRDTTINNEKWFVVERKDPANIQYGLLKFTTDGMYNYRNGSGKMDFKFNASVNDTWTNSNGETAVVKAINQSVTVPAGTFTNTIYIETHDSNDPGIENKSWYNDKEFMLKSEEYDDGGTVLDYRDELKNVVF